MLLRLEGEYIRVRAREARELLENVRAEHGTTAAARERFRMGLVRRFYAAYGQTLGGAAIRDGEQIERALRANGYLTASSSRRGRRSSPEKLVRPAATRRPRSREAAEGLLDDRRAAAAASARQRAGATATCRCSTRRTRSSATPPRTFGHVIVDEAQDLTPMQLRMVARRARDGSLTILGDVAQGTGPVVYGSWGEVLPHLPRGDEADVEELRHAYRVPREIMDLALPLLDLIAPDVERPLAYRTGADPPRSGGCPPRSFSTRLTARRRASRAARVSSR